ncbi:MAG: M48 family metalloprotease [Nitrospirae bacterium]|nr:M48 family metalloprotease [Nitrospirota bacterium]MBI3352456.1 M48 family metalloprotease [Nitrospirota bacterium]
MVFKREKSFLRILFGTVVLFALVDCASFPGQTRQEATLPPLSVPDDETRSKKMGKEFLSEARKQFTFVQNPDVIDAVTRVGRSILLANGENPQNYHFLVVKNEVPNAFAVPGGYIFVFDGLLSRMTSVEELAGVLSHEIGHVTKDHFFQENKGAALANVAGIVAALLTREPSAAIAGALTAESLGLSFSREHEREADSVGLRFLNQAGYHPEGLYHFFKTLEAYEKYNPSLVPAYFSTHPAVGEREATMQMLIRGLPPPPADAKPVSLDWDRIRALVGIENNPNKPPSEFFLDPFKKGMSEEEKHYLTGLILLNNDRLREAVVELQNAIGTGSNNSFFHSTLAYAFFKLNQIPQARSEASLSATLDSANGEAEMILGFIGEVEKNKEVALAHYERANLLRPNDPRIFFKLGALYASMGRTKEALWSLAQFYRSGYQIEKALKELAKAREAFAGDQVFRSKVEAEMKDIIHEGL